jgi:hypothetical protein
MIAIGRCRAPPGSSAGNNLLVAAPRRPAQSQSTSVDYRKPYGDGEIRRDAAANNYRVVPTPMVPRDFATGR